MKKLSDVKKGFCKQFPLPKFLVLSGGKGVERDNQLAFIEKSFKELLESCPVDTSELVKKIEKRGWTEATAKNMAQDVIKSHKKWLEEIKK